MSEGKRLWKQRSCWRWLLAVMLVMSVAFVWLQWREGIGIYDASHVVNPCLEVPPNGEHRAKANCEGLSRAGGQEAVLRFNSLGLRDKEYPSSAPIGVTRVLMLGSSNALGLGTEERDSIPRRLEAELRARGMRVEVINAATVGYCTIQTSFRVRELMEKYRPHVVLYQLVIGTCPLFDAAWSGRVRFEGNAPVRIDRTPFRWAPPAVNQALFRSPRLYFLWLTAADQLRKAWFSWNVFPRLSEARRAEAVLEPSLRYLSWISSEVSGAGARFVLASYNMHTIAQPVPVHFSYRLVRMLSPLILPFRVSADALFGVLRARGFELQVPNFNKNDYLIDGDQHFTAEGYRFYSAAMAALLAPTLGGKR